LGLASKLFFALLAAILMAALATSVAFSVSVRASRFVPSVNHNGMERTSGILVAYYRLQGTWDFLRQNPRAWLDLLRDAGVASGPVDETRGPPGRLAPQLPGLLASRLAVWDERRQFVVGNSQLSPDTPALPIIVNAIVVGWLAGTAPVTSALVPVHVSTSGWGGFSWMMVAGAVLIAALAAVSLTRWLLWPIRDITAATHQLAAGDYATRLKVSSHDEIGHLADDFNRLAAILEKNELMRRDFMADVSHELRTPLAVLRGELEAFEDGVHDLTLEGVRSLQSEVRTLGKLVDDLYDLSLADVGALRYRMSDVDITELLREKLRGFHDRLAERNIAVESDISEQELIVRGDEIRIKQLFGNLLENALRYTDPGGVLRVSCRREHVRVVIDFQDSEPGVSQERLPRLFERFYRVETSRNRDTGGAGLGLAISKSIVEAHGGTIAAQASSLGGLWVGITLPAAR
jgi:two-component system sensor histidine kinase BaeS